MNNVGTPRILSQEEGQPYWYLNGVMNIKLTAADTNGQFSLVDELVPAGSTTPYHIHHNEDETFYIIEGEAEFVVDGRLVSAKTGAVIFLPKNVPHGFRIIGDRPARILNFLTPGGAEQLFVQAGEPAASLELPPPSKLNIPKVIEVAKKLNCEVLGTLVQFINE
jgi:quercetin dioxygenase-like cupin family protein